VGLVAAESHRIDRQFRLSDLAIFFASLTGSIHVARLT
jgi:hypothetical protein